MFTKPVISIVLGALLSLPAASIDAAELSKADAAKLLTSMGHKNVVVVGVIQGVGGIGMAALSSPNVAMVIAYAELNGKPKDAKATFFYDKDLGWFDYEIDTTGRRARIWTTTGYKELRPGN